MTALTDADWCASGDVERAIRYARTTLYHRFNRFTERSSTDAVMNGHRRDGPTKLNEHEQMEFVGTLQRSPTVVGFARSSWTSELLREHIEHGYGVSYSLDHTRRLVRQAHFE